MGTFSFIFCSLLLDSVSNPLGWDGDSACQLILSTASEVSNPLGWDGDCARYAGAQGYRVVSNPLGWDGD